MEFDRTLSDAARSTLARLGCCIKYTENFPDGNVDLSESGVADVDLHDFVFYPGFAGLSLARTEISDGGARVVGEMRDLETLSLHNTSITDDAIAAIGGLLKLTELRIGTDPG